MCHVPEQTAWLSETNEQCALKAQVNVPSAVVLTSTPFTTDACRCAALFRLPGNRNVDSCVPLVPAPKTPPVSSNVAVAPTVAATTCVLWVLSADGTASDTRDVTI